MLFRSEKGDFESIEFVKDTMWGMTSKGKLVKVWNLEKTPFDVQIFKIESLKTANIEGMGYDNLNHRLLLAAKGDKADGTTVRTVWAFDLEKQAPSVKKVFDVQLTDFQAFLKSKSEKKYAKLTKDYVDSPVANGFEFGPSGIAVHPLTGHLYIVSSVNKVLVVLSPEGQIAEKASCPTSPFLQKPPDRHRPGLWPLLRPLETDVDFHRAPRFRQSRLKGGGCQWGGWAQPLATQCPASGQRAICPAKPVGAMPRARVLPP